MKTILVLDDDFVLLSLLCSLLQRHGYHTLEAGNTEDALRRFHDNHRQIDLLIADVTLPLGSGIQAASALRAELPDLPVILASGYPSDTWTAGDSALLGRLGSDLVSILLKPFAPQTLMRTISELIGAEQTNAARAV